MISSGRHKGIKPMMEGFGEIMVLEETAKYLKIGKSPLYKMAGEGKIPAVKIESGKDNKIIIRVPYDQELIKKIKTILSRTNLAKIENPLDR